VAPQQKSDPFIVTIVQQQAPQQTLKDVVLNSLGVAGVLLLGAMILGAVLAVVLVTWNRRHPPEGDHLPPVSPLVPDPDAPPSSQAR